MQIRPVFQKWHGAECRERTWSAMDANCTLLDKSIRRHRLVPPAPLALFGPGARSTYRCKSGRFSSLQYQAVSGRSRENIAHVDRPFRCFDFLHGPSFAGCLLLSLISQAANALVVPAQIPG